MFKTVTGVLLDTKRARVERATIPATLGSYYEHLNCTTIDIVSRTIGGKRFDIICDDEGTFKDDPHISALDRDYQPMFVGNLFVCKHDDNGIEVSLTDKEISHILRFAHKIPTRQHPEGLAMLTDVGY